MNGFWQPKQLSKIFLFLFIFFLPTQLGKHFFLDFSYVSGIRVDYLSLVLYFTDLLFLILSLSYFSIIVNYLRKNSWRLAVLGFFLAINILISKYPLFALYRLLKIIEFYFLLVIFRNFKNPKLVLTSFLLGGLFQLILALAQLYQRSALQGIFYFFGERYLSLSQPGIAKASFWGEEFLRPYATFSHPNSLAGFYLLLYFYFLTNRKFNRFIFLKNLSFLIFSLLVFISFSKVAIFTYLILNFIYFIFFRQEKKLKCRLCLLAKITSVFVVAAIFLQAKTDPLSLEKRLQLFQNGLDIFLRQPVFGVGLNHYLIYQAQIPIKYPYFFLQPVHNIFVLFLAETGTVLGGMIFYWLIRFFKNKVKRHGNASLLVCGLVVLISGSFDHYWLTLQQNWLLLAVIFGSI